MTRYIRVKLADDDPWWDKGEFLPALTVNDATPQFTGILDFEGYPIVRLPRPIGFGRDNEW
jgi:hypothetical protein